MFTVVTDIWEGGGGVKVKGDLSDLVLLLQELQVGNLVGAEVVDDVVALEELGDLGGLLLVLFELVEDLLATLGVLGGGLLEALELAVEVGDVVGHVGLLEEGVLGGEDLASLVGLIFLEAAGVELEEGEDHVAVEVGSELEDEVIVGGRGVAVGGGGGCGSHRECLWYMGGGGGGDVDDRRTDRRKWTTTRSESGSRVESRPLDWRRGDEGGVLRWVG